MYGVIRNDMNELNELERLVKVSCVLAVNESERISLLSFISNYRMYFVEAHFGLEICSSTENRK